jgi:hypothetical protein
VSNATIQIAYPKIKKRSNKKPLSDSLEKKLILQNNHFSFSKKTVNKPKPKYIQKRKINEYYTDLSTNLNRSRKKTYHQVRSNKVNIQFDKPFYKTIAASDITHKPKSNPNENIDLVLSILQSQNEYNISKEKNPKKITSGTKKSKFISRPFSNSKNFSFKKKTYSRDLKKISPFKINNYGFRSTRIQKRLKSFNKRIDHEDQRNKGRVYSNIDNYVPPKNPIRALKKKYSHKILTKPGNKVIIQNISKNENQIDQKMKITTNEEIFQQKPHKLSSSKSQSILLKGTISLPKIIKKSNSTFQIQNKFIQRDSHFKTPVKINQSNFKSETLDNFRRGTNTTMVGNVQEKRTSTTSRSISRSRSRKINLANYKVSRLDKSKKSLKKYHFTEQFTTKLPSFHSKYGRNVKLQTHSLQNNVIPANIGQIHPKESNIASETFINYNNTNVIKKSPLEKFSFEKYGFGYRRKSNEDKIKIIKFDNKTQNLKSDYLESNSKNNESELNSSFKKSPLQTIDRENTYYRVISNVNPETLNKQNIPNLKRSASTNVNFGYVKNLFPGNQNLIKPSQFS